MTTPRASIVIPAHNESGVIERCLDALGARRLGVQVVVVANACTDDTASLARKHGAAVVEVDRGGKANALNVGDTIASAFPRVYLDADVVLEEESLDKLLRTLEDGTSHVATPALVVDMSNTTLPVRWYYDVWTSLPYVTSGLIGSGLYAVSQRGRDRWAEFPDVIADDAMVRRLFTPAERGRPDQAFFTVFPPRDIRTLIRVKTRVRIGNLQLEDSLSRRSGHGSGHRRRLLASVLRPHRIPRLFVFAVVEMAIRRQTRVRIKRGDYNWTRDLTSR